MLSIPGNPGSTCDGWSRREFIRVGGAGLFGVGLGDVLKLQAIAAESASDAAKSKAGWGKAKSVVLLFLQGGPSHLDIWDPKPEAPSNIRGEFKTLRSKVPGIWLSEVMPKLAEQMDKATLVRSLNYTPAGLFNHTAAIYQMMTGYTPDRVSPSGQLEPPSPNDFPHAGSQIARLKPPTVPMLPFVLLPRPLQESNVIGKGGTGGFLGEAFDLVSSGRARNAFDLTQEPAKLRDTYGRHTFGQGLLLARRLIEAGTRFVQVNWPAVANGDPNVDAWDTHAANFGPLRNLHCPKLDSALSALLEDLDQRGMLKDTIVLAIGEFGRSPRLGVSTSGNGNAPDGRDHWPYCYTALIAGAGIRRGALYGKSDATGSSPAELPVHPTQLLATIYHALAIEPHTIVLNHLNQPRELVQAEPVTGLFG